MPPVVGPEGLGSLWGANVLEGLSVRVGLADWPGWGEGGTPAADDLGSHLDDSGSASRLLSLEPVWVVVLGVSPAAGCGAEEVVVVP